MTLVDRLRRLDACAVSDALDKLGQRGTVTGIFSLTGPVRIAGRVVTVKLVAAHGRSSERHLCTAAVEGAEPGDVIVVEHHDRDDCAGWGGILSLAAKARGLSGTIVDGFVRDVDESREAGYPVFARGAVPVSARERVIEAGWNVPVEIGDISVAPGDLVVADGSGLVFLRAGESSPVLDVAERIAARERAMVEAVEAGKPVSEAMGSDYETMLKDDPGNG